jgi:major type 1 subunit fimbrin (pilin)
MHKSSTNIPSGRLYKTGIITLMLAATIFLPGVVRAADGTIEFEGKILAATCNVEAGSNATKSGKQIKVKLLTIGASSFTAIGQKAGITRFSVKLNNCEATAKTVRLNFDSAPFYTYGSGGTPGVELELANVDGTKVDYNAPASFPEQTLASTAAEIWYSVSYVSTAPSVSAGTINASIPFTVAYD